MKEKRVYIFIDATGHQLFFNDILYILRVLNSTIMMDINGKEGKLAVLWL